MESEEQVNTTTTSQSLPASSDEAANSRTAQQLATRRRSSAARAPRRISEAGDEAEDAWWWEIEQENLILDQGIPISRLLDENEPAVSNETQATISSCSNLPTNKLENSSSLPSTATNSATATPPTDIPKKKCENLVERIESIKNKSLLALSPPSHDEEQQSMEAFKEELRVKRLARQTAVQDLRNEIAMLRSQLSTEQELNRRLRKGEPLDELKSNTSPAELQIEAKKFSENEGAAQSLVVAVATAAPDADDTDAISRSRHANIELANAQLALQIANADNLSLKTEVEVVNRQVGTLKEVIACCKQMLSVKEEQCNQLKAKLTEIENSFGERELKIMSNNLRQEYERQLGNIRQLRQLYEERQRVAAAEHENLQRLISIKRDELLAEQEKMLQQAE